MIIYDNYILLYIQHSTVILFDFIDKVGVAVLPEERLARRNSRRKIPRRYHKKVARPSGAQGWQGCRDLPQSAAYPYHFCLAILKLWTALFMSSSISVPVL
jgi:hypothetical protein